MELTATQIEREQALRERQARRERSQALAASELERMEALAAAAGFTVTPNAEGGRGFDVARDTGKLLAMNIALAEVPHFLTLWGCKK
jgi:hypothetical protein